MDKKGTRAIPDVTNTKQWHRGNRHRESPSTSLSSKNEPSRKPQVVHIKQFDKRPKTRGGRGTVVRNEASPLVQEDAELGSVFVPGSKKQSLNHLLNFSYAPRDTYAGRTNREGKGNRALHTKKHKYNKEHFLQANCQFIVNEIGNYKPYLNNPDVLVDWNLIEQVMVQVSECPSCPICLCPPVAAKMTRCGHIYCWSCVLHYLSFSEKQTRKCPICEDMLHKKDLRSVVAIPHSTINVDETITFKLMKRPRDSFIAYPDDHDVEEDKLLFRMSENNSSGVYCKLLLANNSDILSIIARERRELHQQLQDRDYFEICFVEEAEVSLNERESAVLISLDKTVPSESCDKSAGIEALEDLEIRDRLDETDLNVGDKSSRYYYFYQASDGQHIYLHAINARMLEHTYGDLKFGPKTLTGKILEKEGGSMTEELRKRFRYLQHLPVTCQFEVAEIQLESPVVDKDTIEHFQDQLEQRHKKRQRVAKEEKRREKQIAIKENRSMGKYPTPNIRIDSNVQFPEFVGEARFRTESESTVTPSEMSHSPDMEEPSPTYAGPSFATMLAKEKKQASAWPLLKSVASTPESTSKFINVTGSKMATVSPVRTESDSDTEQGFEPVPTFNTNFGDHIARALQQQAVKVEEQGKQAKGKKKKKQKHLPIFSTSMVYSGK